MTATTGPCRKPPPARPVATRCGPRPHCVRPAVLTSSHRVERAPGELRSPEQSAAAPPMTAPSVPPCCLLRGAMRVVVPVSQGVPTPPRAGTVRACSDEVPFASLTGPPRRLRHARCVVGLRPTASGTEFPPARGLRQRGRPRASWSRNRPADPAARLVRARPSVALARAVVGGSALASGFMPRATRRAPDRASARGLRSAAKRAPQAAGGARGSRARLTNSGPGGIEGRALSTTHGDVSTGLHARNGGDRREPPHARNRKRATRRASREREGFVEVSVVATAGREREGFVEVSVVATAGREREGFVEVSVVATAGREREGFVEVSVVATAGREREGYGGVPVVGAVVRARGLRSRHRCCLGPVRAKALAGTSRTISPPTTTFPRPSERVA
jgi:hypothetical protein